jgi:hypothetical protein
MRNPRRGSLALFAACLLLGAGQALAADEPHVPPAPAVPDQGKPGQPAAAAADARPSPKPYIDHELTDAEKAALAKRRMESCRLHPGTCEQGAKGAKGGKVKSRREGQPKAPKAPEEAAQK